MHNVPPDESQLGKDQELNKSYSSRDTNNDARNPHYGISSSIQFQDGPETYSNFKYLQELWVFIEKWYHQSTEAKKQEAIKENWKNNFVSLHAMSSAQRNQKRGWSKNIQYIIIPCKTTSILYLIIGHQTFNWTLK